jgi:hypothetical protein
MSLFSTTFALRMHNFVITSYNKGIMKATCKSPIGLRRKKRDNPVKNLIFQALQLTEDKCL